MKTADEILHEHGITSPPPGKGRYYTTCPQCSARRSRAHQKAACLGVTIKDDGVTWGCNHCLWTGGGYYNGRISGPAGEPARTYDYLDEQGNLLFQKVRNPPGNAQRFWQRKPDGKGGWINNTRDVRKVLYRLPEVIEAIASERTILVVEGEKDADSLWRIGIPATCSPDGAADTGKTPKWRPEYSKSLRGADIVVIPDNDAPGYAHADATLQTSKTVAKRVRVLTLAKHWPDCLKGGDISDWLAAGHTREEFDALIERAPDHGDAEDLRGKMAESKAEYPPRTIEEVVEVFERWLLLSDRAPIYAVLGAVAANLLPGDAVWLGLIGPPSSAKTEILNSTSLLPGVIQAATLTPGGLLSGTPKKQQAKGAVGGLLRQIGDFGILALKDFGTILSMRPDAKPEILAALREIYDGAWTRHLGSDGGRVLEWKGKVGLIFCCTGVIDSHYSVIGAMGDRFLLSRLAPVGEGQFFQALKHVGAATGQMRKELAEAVAGLFAARRPEPQRLSNDEIKRLDNIVTLVVKLRGAIERDRNTREIEAVFGAEGTARVGLMLERLLAGLDTLGVEREMALNIVEDVAMSSVPPLRRRAYEFLKSFAPTSAPTSTAAKALGLPTNTVRRALEDLAAYGLVTRSQQGTGNPDMWRLT